MICPECKGSGEWGRGMDDIRCHHCQGYGKVFKYAITISARMFVIRENPVRCSDGRMGGRPVATYYGFKAAIKAIEVKEERGFWPTFKPWGFA